MMAVTEYTPYIIELQYLPGRKEGSDLYSSTLFKFACRIVAIVTNKVMDRYARSECAPSTRTPQSAIGVHSRRAARRFRIR